MDNILISSSNKGGLFLYRENRIYEIDRYASTGLSILKNKIVRVFHPRDLVLSVNGFDHLLNADSSVEYGDVHDVLLSDDFIYLVDTTGNSILKLNGNGDEIDRWTFQGEPDSWHINCLARWNDRFVFSAFGQFHRHREYKGKTLKTGFIQDLHSNELLLTGLSQPHSLIQYGAGLLLANSECKEVIEVDSQFNIVKRVMFDGYTRGICVGENHIYVGLSRSRNIENSKQGGAEIVILEKEGWRESGRVSLPVEEIYCLWLIEDGDLLNVLPRLFDFSAKKTWKSLMECESRILEQDARILEQDARVAGLEIQLQAILNSKSWLVTKPLRWIGKIKKS